jgi:hypothetical protein
VRSTNLTLDTHDQYAIQLQGLKLGTFTLVLQEFVDDHLVSTLSYTDIPVSETTHGRLTLQHVADASQLKLDIQGNGVSSSFVLAPGTKPDTLTSLRILTGIVRTLGLPKGIETSLTSKLDAATEALEHGDQEDAIVALGALISEVRAQEGKKIPAATAEGLIGVVNRLLTSVI